MTLKISFRILFYLLLLFTFQSCGDSNPKPNTTQTTNFNLSRFQNLEEKSNGDYSCTAYNLSTGNGPYQLQCEKDNDEIIIHFPNGGYIVTDEDGFHFETGDIWDIDLEN